MDIDHINVKQCLVLCKCANSCFYGWIRTGKMVKAINYRSSRRTPKYWNKQAVLDAHAAIKDDVKEHPGKHNIPKKPDIIGDYSLVNQVLNRSINT